MEELPPLPDGKPIMATGRSSLRLAKMGNQDAYFDLEKKMKNDPNEIHFECPKCKRPMSGDKALLGEMINCPDCNEPFIPTPRKPEPAPEPAKTSAPASAQNPDNIRAKKIRNQANHFTVVAGVFCGLGLLLALSQLARAISGEEGAGSGFIVAASLIGTSLWFYLIAQIIHIRANTEK